MVIINFKYLAQCQSQVMFTFLGQGIAEKCSTLFTEIFILVPFGKVSDKILLDWN